MKGAKEILARTTPSSSQSLSSTDVTVAMKTLGAKHAKGPQSWRRRRRRQTLMNSEEKIAYLWRIGWKPKAYTSCAPYLKVFKNDLYL